MKKILLTGTLFLFCIAIFAQKVKINKDQVFIDGKVVGYVYNYKNAEAKDIGFVYTDLSKQDTLFLVKRNYPEGLFYDISASFSPNKSEIDYEATVFSLKDISLVTNLIVQSYQFITLDGLNKERIVKYLNGQRVTREDLLRRLNGNREADQSQAFRSAGSSSDLSRTDVTGILTTKKQENIEGRYRIYFRDTDDGRVNVEKGQLPSLGLNNPYTGVTYLYEDNTGKEKKKVYSAANLEKLEIKRADGQPEIYDVISRNHIKSVLSIHSDGSVNPKGSGTLTKKQFALRIIETPTMSLHRSWGDYFISKKGQNAMPILKGQIKEQLLVLSENCPEIMAKVDNDLYANYDEEQLIKFVLDYNSCANNPFKAD